MASNIEDAIPFRHSSKEFRELFRMLPSCLLTIESILLTTRRLQTTNKAWIHSVLLHQLVEQH